MTFFIYIYDKPDNFDFKVVNVLFLNKRVLRFSFNRDAYIFHNFVVFRWVYSNVSDSNNKNKMTLTMGMIFTKLYAIYQMTTLPK